MWELRFIVRNGLCTCPDSTGNTKAALLQSHATSQSQSYVTVGVQPVSSLTCSSCPDTSMLYVTASVLFSWRILLDGMTIALSHSHCVFFYNCVHIYKNIQGTLYVAQCKRCYVFGLRQPSLGTADHALGTLERQLDI